MISQVQRSAACGVRSFGRVQPRGLFDQAERVFQVEAAKEPYRTVGRAAGRPSDAYRIVDQVLSRDPDFDDFQDLKDSPEFLSWRRANT